MIQARASSCAYLLANERKGKGIVNIYKLKYSAKTIFVNTQMRLKNFVLHFVTLTAKWVKTGRRHILKIFTQKDYSLLFAT